MATCATMLLTSPGVGLETEDTQPPLQPPLGRLLTELSCLQSLSTPILISPFEETTPVSPDGLQWPLINVISPSVASDSGRSPNSLELADNEDNGLRAPNLGIVTNELGIECGDVQLLISPSALRSGPGEELLYDTANEPKPEVPYYQSELQDILEQTRDGLADLGHAILPFAIGRQRFEDMAALKSQALQLSRFDPKVMRRIAVVNCSGIKKCNDTIAALLDDRGLIDRLGLDRLHHSVCREYHYRPSHDADAAAIEIEFKNTEEINDMLDELLCNFWRPYRDDEQKWTDFQSECLDRRQSNEAWCTLDAMFRHRSDFTTESLVSELKFTNTGLVDDMRAWALDFIESQILSGSEIWSKSSPNLQNRTNSIKLHARDFTYDMYLAMGPYLRSIRLFIQSPLLQSGIVLVNVSYPRSTLVFENVMFEDLLNKCDEIYVSTSIEEVLVNADVHSILHHFNASHRVNILCADSLDFSSATYGELDTSTLLQVKIWQEQIDKLRRQVKMAEAQRRRCLPHSIAKEIQLHDMLEDMRFGLKRFVIEDRRSKISREFLIRHQDLGDEQRPGVFYVCSEAYWEHRDDEKEKAAERLQVSGITELRKRYFSITAQAHFDAAMSYLENQVPAYLSSLKQRLLPCIRPFDVNASTEPVDMWEDSRQLAVFTPECPTAQIDGLGSVLHREFAAAVTTPMRRNRSDWKMAAIEASKQWSKLHQGEYSGYCRRAGMTADCTGGPSWNAILVAPVRRAMRDDLEFFRATVQEVRDEFMEGICDIFGSARAILLGMLEQSPAAIKNLVNTLDHRLAIISRIVASSFTRLHRGLDSIELTAFEGHVTSHMASLMMPVYRLSRRPHMSHVDCKAAITSHIESYRIFPKLADMVERDYDGLVDQVLDGMSIAIRHEIDALEEDVAVATDQISRNGHDTDARLLEPLIGKIAKLMRTVRGS